ncbi:MAG: ABC transporter permease [Actinomycetota bacterium]
MPVRPSPNDVAVISHDDELAGIDALETPVAPRRALVAELWSSTWTKLAAFALLLLAWQAVVWSHVRPDFVLPGPLPVFERVFEDLKSGELLKATATTMRRAALGYGIAVVAGLLLGAVVARRKLLRSAVGSLITGLQTMPTIAWFPLAILVFGLNETAITFVVVLGAAPAIANGLISGIDHIPTPLLRAGQVLGARGLRSFRHVILPGAFPGFVAGLKQGWAFAWRSLMAGELLVIIATRPALGVRLQFLREISDAPGLIATMVAILVIGIAVDSLGFARLERWVLRRWGLAERKH